MPTVIPTSTPLVVRVDEQRRLELDPSLLQSALGVSVPSGQTVHLWAITGSEGQLQVLAQENELAKIRQAFDASVIKNPPSWDSGGDEYIEVIRKILALLPISVCAEKNRRKLRITLPTEVVDLGLVKTKDWIVVLAVGEIIELWPVATWRTASAIGDVRKFVKQAKEILEL
jgi:hypothetical protein